MANTFHLQIVTPDSIKFDGQAERIIVRSLSGDVCILARHIDYAAPLSIGKAKMVDAEGNERIAACNSGFISVVNGEVCVASATFEWAEEIDVERALSALHDSEAKLKSAKQGDMEYIREKARFRRALARLSAVKK